MGTGMVGCFMSSRIVAGVVQGKSWVPNVIVMSGRGIERWEEKLMNVSRGMIVETQIFLQLQINFTHRHDDAY